jgi:SAM-dependent methyltransferase
VTPDGPVLAEQLAYYRARAPEYDKWFRREGLYDWGQEQNAKWRGELEEVQDALDRFAPAGEVLELAYGTGEWTLRLAAMASRVTGIDAAPEMRARASAKLRAAGHTNVDLLIGDLFAWEPDQVYDAVFFAFWLSHVPLDLADRFWENVHDSLRPWGRFFLADNARVRIAERSELPGVVIDGNIVHHSSGALDLATSFDLRRLEDGRRYRVVKRSFDPDELARDLRERGLEAHFVETERFFVYGSGTRR